MRTHARLTALAITLGLSCFAAPFAHAASDTWTGTTDANFSSPGNWTGGNAPPIAGDSLVFGVTSGSTTLNDDLTNGIPIDGITFSGGSAFTLNGHSILISSLASNNTFAAFNESGLSQTFGTMALTLDRGYYTFGSPDGGSVAINGGLSLNTGGVAYFDANCTSTALTLDNTTGLITGLEGNGLIFDGNLTPTGLATISGGTIFAYSSYTSVNPGAISSGNNLMLNATGSGTNTYTSANGTTVNTISAAQTGNAGGSNTTALNLTGTLTLGQNGGIYLLTGDNGNKNVFTVNSGTLTAGTSGPATITLGVNGNNANNQVSVSSTIVNNAGSGAVTVIKTGTGSMNFATTTTSSYSGGLYIDQGQVQCGQPQQVGTGSVFVSPSGSLYYIGTATLTNNIFIFPGPGANGVSATGTGMGFGFGGSCTYSGTLNLLGSAVASFPTGTISAPTGDTIAGNTASITDTMTGQITGTGTLEITGAHSYTLVLKNTNTATPNNWQGGMIMGGHGGSAVNVLVQMGATNQIPSGPGTGDLAFAPAEGGTANASARFEMNGFNQTVNGLIASTPNANPQAFITNSGNPCTLTFGANNDNATNNGAVADKGLANALSLVKIGTGTQIFGYNLNEHGNFTVNAGSVVLQGSAGLGNTPVITVAAGTTLDGSLLSSGGLSVVSGQTLNCVGTLIGNTSISGTVETLDAIGTLLNTNGGITFNGGATYIWDMNNATGTAGADPGWSLLNATTSPILLNISSTPATIKITSLTAGDVPGLASNFNPNVTRSWTIAKGGSPISGFSPSQFLLDTSGFANPTGSGTFSLGLSGDSTALVLTFTSTPVITVPPLSRTNNAGTTATFSATAGGASLPITFTWTDPNNNQLTDGGITASGATVGITNSGKTTTLTLHGVEDSDAGVYSINASDTVGDSGSANAQLVIIDPPSNPQINQSLGQGIAAGGVVALTASAGGTAPFTYAWYFNGVLISGGSGIGGQGTSNIVFDLSPAFDGDYKVVISNGAGSATNDVTLGPVTSVPGQIVYEPFTSYAAVDAASRPFDNIDGTTNLYNELTGGPAFWFHSSGSGIQMVVALNDMGNGVNNAGGGSYPWPGLAGNSTNLLYWTESLNSHLEFGQTESFQPNSKVYVSFIMSCVTVGGANGVQDVLAGFTTSDSGTAFNLKVCSQIVNVSANQYQLGIAKANGVGSTQSVDTNTLWDPNLVLAQQAVLVVACYNINSGGNVATDDTVSMWINPNPTNFYASEANVPAPDVGPASFGVANSQIRDFAVHSVNAPVSHRIADLRIGTTWASVTPPAAPTMYVGNVYAPLGTTASFASQNAGNPVTTYSWQFNGGAPLTDNAKYSGTGSNTLTIANVSPSDYGTYTVTGVNTDPLTFTNLTGSASAVLSPLPPKLSAKLSGTNVIVAWPTNWLTYTLQQTPTLIPKNWTASSFIAPYPVVGTNNAVTVPAASNQFFRLMHH